MSDSSKPQTHQLKNAHLLRVGEQFTLPHTGTPHPFFEVLGHENTNDWKVKLVVKVLSIPTFFKKIGKETVPQQRTRAVFHNTTVETGTLASFIFARDEPIILFNPRVETALRERLSRVISRGIARKGQICMEYTLDEPDLKWMEMILYSIRITLLQEHMIHTEITIEPGKITGLLNALPGHPDFPCQTGEPYTPLPAVAQISSNLDDTEHEAISQLLICYIREGSDFNIHRIDGQMQISLVLEGSTYAQWTKYQALLETQLTKCYLTLDLDEDNELPEIRGFISRNSNLQEKINREAEGTIIT